MRVRDQMEGSRMDFEFNNTLQKLRAGLSHLKDSL